MVLAELINKLTGSEISIKEFQEFIPEGRGFYVDEILELFRQAIVEQDGRLVEYLLIAIDKDGADKRYSNILCELLAEWGWNYKHEDIIMTLDEIRDPSTVDCIYKTSLKELDYDEGRSLQKKCIWALGSIGTPLAIEKLRLLASSENTIVRDAAKLELK